MKPSIPLAVFLTFLAGSAPVVLAPSSPFCPARAQAQTIPTPPNFGADRPLMGVLENIEGLPLSAVRMVAAQQADATHGPKYRNIPTQLPFYAAFDGSFTPTRDDTRLAIFSDDGCNVFLDGVRIVNNLGRGQHLPKLDESLHLIGIFSECVLGVFFGLSEIPVVNEPVESGLEPVKRTGESEGLAAQIRHARA